MSVEWGGGGLEEGKRGPGGRIDGGGAMRRVPPGIAYFIARSITERNSKPATK